MKKLLIQFQKKNIPAIVYFGIKGDKQIEAEKIMEKLAEKFGGKLNVIMTEVNSGLGKQISNYIGLKEQELPSMRILDKRRKLKRYIMKGEIIKKILIIPIKWEKLSFKPIKRK